MNGSSPPASPAHSRSAPAQQRRLSSTRPVPSTIDTANVLPDSTGDGFGEKRPTAHPYEDRDLYASLRSGETGLARGLPASASSTSISPSATSNRVVRRRGSSRSSSFASTGDAAGDLQQEISAHLAPQQALPRMAAPANASQGSVMHAHRRDVSADITGQGMFAHSRDNSNSSEIIVYSPSTRNEKGLQPRPPSTSAWSNFSLYREYGLGDTSSVDLNHNEEIQYENGEGDNDARYLTDLNAAGRIFPRQVGLSFDADLERPAADASLSSNGPRRGISRRVKGTERYYRDSRNAAWSAGAPARQRSMIGNVQHSLRKMSVRVVNLAQVESDGRVPLSDDAEELLDDKASGTEHKDRLQNESVIEYASIEAGNAEAPQDSDMLRGKSLGLFGADSKLRNAALKLFLWSWTEPLLLLLIVANVVILTIQSAKNIYEHPRPTGAGYFREWEDYALFVIFVAFTLEIMARILVSGFIFNAEESRHTRTYKERIERFRSRLNGQFVHAPVMQRSESGSAPGMTVPKTAPWDYPSTADMSKSHLNLPGTAEEYQPSNVQTSPNESESEYSLYPPRPEASVAQGSSPTEATWRTGTFTARKRKGLRVHEDVPFVHALSTQRARNANASGQKAFLRHSWNRIDFLAILAFWTVFCLASTGLESKHTLYIFRALAALRAARLLTVTNGTATILRSLKQSAPLMVSVAFFVVFAMALFSIVGVYSFKGSFQRSCVWIDPRGDNNVTFGDQRCGGHVDARTGDVSAYIPQGPDARAVGAPKGYICPSGQLCMDVENPYNGTQSFDNVFAALLQVVIITGANGWVDLMYAMIDAEYFISCIFFIVCVVLLNFWLMNIFVAVIINTFGNIREETKHSAFAGRSRMNVLDRERSKIEKEGRSFSTIWRRRIAFISKWAWTAAIVADVGIQASKTAEDSSQRIEWLNRAELYFTLAFLVEIIIRFMSYLPNYRKFVRRTRNKVDTILVIVTTIIQIPVIRNSAVYPWLTAFQLMRFYRVILAVPRMKALLSKVLSSVAGLVNMILFLLLMNFIVAVVAVQFLRGQIPEGVDGETVQYSFYQMYNAFLAIYVVFSSENWPDILYNATAAEAFSGQAWISALFISGWFLFANFILLQMFIAVINEGFAIAEEEKCTAQMQAFVKQSQPQAPTVNWISRINPYRFIKARPGILTVDNLPTNLALPGGQAPLPNYMSNIPADSGNGRLNNSHEGHGTFISSLKRAAARKKHPAVGSTELLHGGIVNGVQNGADGHWDVGRQLGLLSSYNRLDTNDREKGEMERRALQVEFIAGHPSYARSLWVFTPANPIRRLCQRLVESAYGERIYGVKPYRTWVAAFKLLILCAITGSVAIAAIATPLYRRDYYLEYGYLRLTWFNLTEISLGFIFVVEFIIKMVADGFIFTPNAYLLSIWNMLDFFVLLTLLVNITAALSPSTIATSRVTRSLKAFRALRLINLSETMRQTFYNVMIVGAGLIFDASILTMLYIIPFSVWGQNLFSGLLYSCNDGDALGKLQCVGEYTASPAGWDILVPRVWQNPYVWSFDSFRSSILILFEIVSLEGWVDVMHSAMAITAKDVQTQTDSSQYNSIFFLIYNLIGAVVVLTLFVSVIIENFSLRSGQALLTSEQQQWVDLKKILARQRPSRRPDQRPSGRFRSWCYDRAVSKHGWWSRMMTGLYVIHIGVLASQTETQAGRVDDSRDYVFLALTLVYLTNIVVGMAGLGMTNFWRNGWNVFDVFAVMGTFATTVPLLLRQQSQIATQLQKLFLVCICFKVVQRNNSLNKLFKTASASLPAILNVFGLWLTLFLVWAIMFLETFSLTRWQENETWMQNYSTFPKAMVMLSFMSTGEGWNAFMHDYTVELPHCSLSSSYLFTDCGDATGAFVLFITWNVISMYIFANMLTGVVVENFSFVFSLYGRTTSPSREEMRMFKSVWSVFDPKRTGYLQSKDIVSFLSRLSGIFDVRIYQAEYRVKALRAACSPDNFTILQHGRIIEGLDLTALDDLLRDVDRDEVARRKRQFNRLYQEALLGEEAGKGISFTNMLLMLARRRMVEPEKALTFEDLLAWQAQQQRVSDLISLERVRGHLQTKFWRRAFLAYCAERRQDEAVVPEIVLEESPADHSSHSTTGDPRRPHLTVDTWALPKPPEVLDQSASPDASLLSPRTSFVYERTAEGTRHRNPCGDASMRSSIDIDLVQSPGDGRPSSIIDEEIDSDRRQ